MKKPGLFLPFLFAALLGSCNPDVFIDSCAPATDQLQVPADGTAATLRFGSGNWYVRGLFLKKQGLYEEIRGDIYNADGTQLYFDVPFHFSDLGRAKYVASYPQFSLTLERTADRELRLSDAENIGLDVPPLPRRGQRVRIPRSGAAHRALAPLPAGQHRLFAGFLVLGARQCENRANDDLSHQSYGQSLEISASSL